MSRIDAVRSSWPKHVWVIFLTQFHLLIAYTGRYDAMGEIELTVWQQRRLKDQLHHAETTRLFRRTQAILDANALPGRT
jgi:hypothetical protein